MHYFMALMLLTGDPYLNTFEVSQLQTLGFLFLKVHQYGYDLGLIFFGLHCLLLGVLLFRSPHFPKALGVLLGLAALAYLADSVAVFVWPAAEPSIAPSLLITFVAELSLGLWLLIKGVNRQPAQ